MGSSCFGLVSACFWILFMIPASGFSTNLPTVSFEEGYTRLFGEENLVVLKNGELVRLRLDERTGSGFVSQDLYFHGFFSASIKLPADYTAGVVVAFYMSNGDVFEKNHDEIDFEFLGNIRGKEWRIQTNVYGNGSTSLGREERYGLWFDPSLDFHRYSILWTGSFIIFYVDNIPIREFKRKLSMSGGDFPSKPMSSYATIWDGSSWATNGGKYKINYMYSPYIVEFSDLVLHGCAVDPTRLLSPCDDPQSLQQIPDIISPVQRGKMESFRKNHLTYSYCYDKARYSFPLPECIVHAEEAERLRSYDPILFGKGRRRRHGKRHQHRGKMGPTEVLFD